MNQIVVKVRLYWEARLAQASVAVLNETIRELRILLQETLTNHFLLLPLPKAKEFRFALGDQLHSVMNGLNNQSTLEDGHHHRYCIQEILTCFEWAEQIKAEIPDDPLTQKILAIDIPILRPFDYGLGKAKPVKRKP